MTLYEIETVYKGLLEHAEENDGDITEIVAELEKVGADLNEKAENYWRIIKNITAEAQMLKAEEERLYKKRKRAENLAASLKDRMANAMTIFEKDKLSTQYGSFAFRKSTKVEVLDEAAIPDAFCKLERKPKLTVIGDAIKAGEIVPGVVVVESRNLQVR